MTDQEPTELMILLKIVEVVGSKMLRDGKTASDEVAVGHIANVVNNFIASSPNLAFAGPGEGVIMGDSYATGPAAAVGRNAIANEVSFVQIWNQVCSAIDLPDLSEQLGQVRSAMRKIAAGDLQQDLSLAEVAQAEISATSNDGPAVMRHLRAAGKWALDVANSIGTEIAAAAIKAAMGLK